MSAGLGARCSLRTLACAAWLLAWPIATNAQPSTDRGWQALDDQGQELYTKGQLTDAIAAARKALEAATSPLESGRSLDRLGFFLHTAGNLREAEQHLRESLRVRETASGADSLEYAETANDLAMLSRDLRRGEEARTLAERAVAIRRQRLPPVDARIAGSLNTLGTVQAIAGEYATAVRTLEEALRIHEAVEPGARAVEEYGTLCVNLAGMYQRLGKYSLASAAFVKGLDILRVSPGPGHPAYAVSLLQYASLRVDLGSFAEAERLYEEGGRLFVEQLGEDHPLYPTMLNNRGLMYQKIGNVERAERDYMRSLELRTKLSLRSSPTSVPLLRNLAQLTYPRDRTASERLLTEAAAILASSQKPPPFDHAVVLLDLATAQRRRGAFADARSTLQQVLSVAQQGLGVRHRLYASAVRDLGLVYQATGEMAEAEHHLKESIAIAEDAHGPGHPELVSYVHALAKFYEEQGDFSAALPLYRRSFDIGDDFLADVLAIGAESVKAASLPNLADPVPALIAFQNAAGDRLPGARVLAFEAVTRRKGRILEQVRGWRQQIRDSTSAEVGDLVTEWESIVKCRTSLTVALGYRDLRPGVVGACSLEGISLEGRYERLLADVRTQWTDALAREAVQAMAALKEHADRIEAALVRRLGESGDPPGRIALADLAAHLKADELLIEYVSYLDPVSEATDSRKYGAFVLDSRATLRWVSIGAATPIDRAVRDLLDAANDWSVSVRSRETRAARESQSTAGDALDEIAGLVWTPLEPLLTNMTGARRLRIAPDASLNLVPFEALSSAGRPLIDRFTITYVPAGRDLVRGANPSSAGPPVIVVSPGGDGGSVSQSPLTGQAFRAGELSRLADAEREAGDLRQLLPSAELLVRSQASEQRVKALRRPAILHVIGHGIVRTDDRCPAGLCVRAELESTAQAMGLSAIVLEEAYGRVPGSPDDGILTAVELQSIDLQGTEMLVLSQCQMANGLPSVGEGVYGMRRAAAVAGVNSLVAPLWNVEDRVQRTLMQSFYRNLVAGQSRGDALRQAKLQVRKRPDTSSFLYWAPVILSGDASPLASVRVAAPRASGEARVVTGIATF